MKPSPRVTKAIYYLIAAVLLMGTLFWTLGNEGYGLQPWKKYQREFGRRISANLSKAEVRSADAEKRIKYDPEYQKLCAKYKQLAEQEEVQSKEIKAKLDDVKKRLVPLQTLFNDFKDPSAPKANYPELEKKYDDLKRQKDDLTQQLDAVMRPSKDVLEAANAYISDRMVDLTPEQLDKLRQKYADWKPTLSDTHISVAEANRGDRCETCHLGMALTGVELTPASMSLPGQNPDEYARAFVTHPKPELLKIHDPAKFGCTSCHGGNGRETSSVERAHGNYPGWPRPLYSKGYIEAGCQTCHAADMVLASGTELAPTLDKAKDDYRQGCMGCHQYQGYNVEPEELNSITQQIRTLEQQKKNNLQQATFKQAQADVAIKGEDARRLNQEAESLTVENSQIDIQLEQLDLRTRDLMREEKKIAHNLKEMRYKLYPNWLPVIARGPGRPTGPTMVTDEQLLAISAFLWQSALPDPIAKQEPGDPVQGKYQLETRGCLGCHAVLSGGQVLGARFAIPLARAGERDKYDYLVRWIQNPRQRIRPYCPLEKKDIGPEDYAKHGLRYAFDLDHDRCPNDGHILQVQQETVMPNLRLTLQESRDIASYLITLKRNDPKEFPEAAVNDPKLKAQGEALVRHYGCPACHEIAGFETQGPIGTELTYEGSKPIDRIDFGQFRHTAQLGTEPITSNYHEDRERLPEGPAKEPWYTLQGFVEHKLAEPNLYDAGLKKSVMEKLFMPNQRLTPDQVRMLTMLMMGSRKTDLPENYTYKPGDARGDIQRGWWLIKKYNCMGCHEILRGQQTALMSMPLYRDNPEQLPPSLITEGARVNPEWLAKFLKNPALSDTDTHRNGVRPYLQVRMPTFNFSNNEIRILVRFFQALSHQPMPYLPEPLPVLTAKETGLARSLFSSPAVPCLKCHANGDPAHDKRATAPNLLLAKERLNPTWVERWIVDPQAISPGTAMPNGLFRKENDYWVINGPIASSFKGYDQDQAKLLVRYLFQLAPEGNRRLSSGLASERSAGGSK
jgi:cytochrome c551/c552